MTSHNFLLRKIFYLTLSLSLLAGVLQIWFFIGDYALSLVSLIYWLLAFTWGLWLWSWHPPSRYYFWACGSPFILGSFFLLCGLNQVGEYFFRLSLIGWIWSIIYLFHLYDKSS